MVTLKSIVSQSHLRFADCVVLGWRLEWGTEIYLKKRKKRDLCHWRVVMWTVLADHVPIITTKLHKMKPEDVYKKYKA